MKKYEYTVAITVKEADEEDVLALIEKLRARLGKVVVQAGEREGRLLRALEHPKKVLTQYQEDKKREREEAYRAKLEEALRATKGSPQGTAKMLGVSVETVRRWVKRFGLQSQLSWRALRS